MIMRRRFVAGSDDFFAAYDFLVEALWQDAPPTSIFPDATHMLIQHVFQLLSRSLCVFVLVLSVIAVAMAAEPTVAGRARKQWCERLQGDDQITRIEAVNALSQFAEVPVDELVAALADENATGRCWAMRGLKRWNGTAGSKEDRLVALSLAKGVADKSAAVRIEAAGGLASRGEAKVALAILEAELRSPVDGVRIQAIGRTGRNGGARRSRCGPFWWRLKRMETST